MSSSVSRDGEPRGDATHPTDGAALAVLRERYYVLDKRKVWRTALAVCGGLLALGLALLVSHTLWLPKVAEFLMVADPLRPAEVIVVLGGGSDHRAMHAAQLYHQGVAPNILTTGGDLHLPAVRLTGAGLAKDVLVREGVPAAIVRMADWTASTEADAAAARAIMAQEDWRTAIVVTEAYHSRRARLIFQRALGPDGRTVIMSAATGRLRPEDWWRRPDNLLAVATEYLKFIALALGLPADPPEEDAPQAGRGQLGRVSSGVGMPSDHLRNVTYLRIGPSCGMVPPV